MRRFTFLRLVVALLLVLGTAAQAAPAAPMQFTDAQKADLKRVSDYLNNVHTMTGNFMQINPDGTSSQGVFYMKKPRDVRFEYAPPTPMLIVSNGQTFAVQNRELDTVDLYPVVSSPLAVLLDGNVDLASDKHTTGVRHEPGLLIVTARETKGPAQGEITLTFSDPGLELRQWDLIDAQGLKTTIIVNNAQIGVAVADSLFAIPMKHGRRPTP